MIVDTVHLSNFAVAVYAACGELEAEVSGEIVSHDPVQKDSSEAHAYEP